MGASDDHCLPASAADGGEGVQQGAGDALEALLPGGPRAAATAEGGGQHGQDGEEDELAVAAGAEMAAHPRYLLHTQGALRRAAQMRGQAAVALQDRVVDAAPAVSAGVSGSRKTAQPPGRSTR